MTLQRTRQPTRQRTRRDGGDRWRTRGRRAAAAAVATPLLLALRASSAAAGDGSQLGQTPPALSWIEVQDSRGISVWNYEMSLDRGGVTSPGKVIWSFLIDLFWQLYRSCVVVAIWFIDWVLSFGWLTVLATPVLSLADSLRGVIARFGLTPALLTVAAVVAVLWMARGKWALGILELFTSLLIASLAVGILANPVSSVTGQDGLIMGSRDFGLEVADALANDGQGSGNADQMRASVTGTLTDTFIRLPAQMINFGSVLDGGSCEQAYDEVVQAGPYGEESDIRDVVAGCDEALGEVAANPGPGQAVSAMVISPAAALILLFAVVLCGAIMLAGVYALYQALKAIVTLVAGLLPGSARGVLWQTAANLTMSLVTLVFSIVFLTSYLLLIRAVFAAGESGTGGVMSTFFFVDVLLVIGIVVFWRGRRSLRRVADRLAAALATRPGTGPTALPARREFNPASAYYKARMARGVAQGAGQAATTVGRGLAGGRDATWSAAGKAASAAGSPVSNAWRRLGFAAGVFGAAGREDPPAPPPGPAGPPRAGGPGGPAGSGGPPTGGAARGGSAGERVTRRLAGARARRAVGGKLLAVGSHAALALVTGGTSTVAAAALTAGRASKALEAARTARGLAVVGRLATKGLPAPAGAPARLRAALASRRPPPRPPPPDRPQG